ncbi:MAG: hypothetical protein U0271_44830 [Polyangiaceae bacterium]
MGRHALFSAVVTCIVALGCGSSSDPAGGGGAGAGGSAQGGATPAIVAEAGFVEAPPREVTVRGEDATIAATARLFYNFIPADGDAASKPVFVLFNGFSANVVRGFGTGPYTVDDGGAVVENPASLTKLANLLYIEPRQAGFSYDVGGDVATRCSAAVFNEYADAADVLFGVLSFLDSHPELKGRIYWVGESYAGVRIQWILAFLRGAWSFAPYADPSLAERIAQLEDPSRLLAGQILLEPWLLGKPHADAIADACTEPSIVDGVSESVGAPCSPANACACASAHGRSPYNYAYTDVHQRARITEANIAETSAETAPLFFGVPLESLDGLLAAERAKGFKCDIADADAPPQDDLVAALGVLPPGQAYFLPYSPLQPGKELTTTPADWRDKALLGPVFVDNLRDVPTFTTSGARDLVVPGVALAPAIATILGSDRVTASPTAINVAYDDGQRTIAVGQYASAGHMITMIEPAAFESDVEAWLASLQ